MEGILFDLDGTLLESEWLARRAYRYGVRQALKRELTEDEIIMLTGQPISHFLTNFLDERESILALIIQYYEQHLAEVQPFIHIQDILSRQHKAGIKMGVVTSNIRRFALQGLKQTEMDCYFTIIIAAEDCIQYKPHPLPLLTAAQHLGVDINNCIYVGDQATDIQAAQAAGMKSAAALWGRDNYQDLIDLQPTFLLTCPKKLLEIALT